MKPPKELSNVISGIFTALWMREAFERARYSCYGYLERSTKERDEELKEAGAGL